MTMNIIMVVVIIFAGILSNVAIARTSPLACHFQHTAVTTDTGTWHSTNLLHSAIKNLYFLVVVVSPDRQA